MQNPNLISHVLPKLLLLLFHILTTTTLTSSSSSSLLLNNTNNTNNIITDQLALLAFKSQISKPPGSNGSLLDNNWNPNTNSSVCNWVGITCSLLHKRVTVLRLPFLNLQGTISPHIGNLSFLKILNLRNNRFQGSLPITLGRLRRLELVNLWSNKLAGPIPPSLSLCHRLQYINLGTNNFEGNIPNEVLMGNLSHLEYINVQFNRLVGTLPSKFLNISTNLTGFLISANNIYLGPSFLDTICRKFSKLEKLYLSDNQLGGHIPNSLSLCKHLKILVLANNDLVGTIPNDLGSLLPNLEYLQLARNQLTGVLPGSLGNLSKLEEIHLYENNLFGMIPKELGKLSNLRVLNIGANNIAGKIPEIIFNLSLVESLLLDSNNLSGNFLELTNFKLPNLKYLSLFVNKLSGKIPSSISNASMLVQLDLSDNFFSGLVPIILGNLRFLWFLNVENNRLINDPNQRELQFLTSLTKCKQLAILGIGSNPLLKGQLPKLIGNFSRLEEFTIQKCQIEGVLPHEIGNLSSLTRLVATENNLDGKIPPSIGNLSRLQRLYLDGNKIQGTLPKELCRLNSLGYLVLSRNHLSNALPDCISNLTKLQYISLSSNSFTSIPKDMWSNLKDVWFLNLSSNIINGHLPYEIGNMVHLQILDLSKNQFSGTIPTTLPNLKMLTSLNLSNNVFQGNFSQLIENNLGSLESLDLSSNEFKGAIPKSLEKLVSLKHLNLSFNMLEGEVPNTGAFRNFTILSFMGNKHLCGNSRLQLPPCQNTSTSVPKLKQVKFWLKYVVSSFVSFILVSAILLVVYKRYWQKAEIMQKFLGNLFPNTLDHKFISYHELIHATNNFSEVNLLGRGGFGTVYKGTMLDGKVFAIKVLNLQLENGFTAFDRECMVLKNVRHRNLVKIISSCSNLDFRALIFEYMSNGSLEKHLHSHDDEVESLGIVRRMDIMIDVGLGIEYLHHGYSEVIVHCDLKSSNVLLDEDMVAHVGDFGIAQILAKDNSMALTTTLGTMGYIAPEFGSEGRVWTKGDIYSYGILMMEMFTGKNPTHEMFNEDLSLKQWISNCFPDQVMEVVDGRLKTINAKAVRSIDSLVECLTSIIELALLCTRDSPEERPDMKDTAVKLKKIKEKYILQTRS